MAISGGPEIEICTLAESPGPNIKIILVAPRAMVAPVLKAVPPPPELTPNTRALGAGEAVARGTMISAPLAAWPGARPMTTGGLICEEVVPGGGVGVGGGVPLLDEPPAQPPMTARAENNSAIRQRRMHPQHNQDAVKMRGCCPELQREYNRRR